MGIAAASGNLIKLVELVYLEEEEKVQETEALDRNPLRERLILLLTFEWPRTHLFFPAHLILFTFLQTRGEFYSICIIYPSPCTSLKKLNNHSLMMVGLVISTKVRTWVAERKSLQSGSHYIPVLQSFGDNGVLIER